MPSSLILAVMVSLAVTLLLFWLLRRIEAWSRSLEAHSRSRRAMHGEWLAEKLLLDDGYTIIDDQVTLDWVMQCDGIEERFTLRLDYLVERDGQEYVAEVKTGDFAPSLRTAATRRQLIEYALAHGSNEILLVDVEACRISTIAFKISDSLSSLRGFNKQRDPLGIAYIE